MQRTFGVSPQLETKIESALKSHFKLSLQDAKPLAEAVKKLSDYFIQTPEGSTPWQESWAQIAYLVYFLPLNHARVQAVVTEAQKQKFFKDLSEVVDFGSGLGTASLALDGIFHHFTLVEKAKDICSRFAFLESQNTEWKDRID